MFTSYAQNFEDVILWRCLKDVEHGTYGDFGANHPVNDSVSYAFYLHGWRGMHVEPISEMAQKLREARPDDIVIEAVVSTNPNPVTFFQVGDGGNEYKCSRMC